jgi:hypothetical protein
VPEIDPYAVLGVTRSANREEIARAYRTLAKRLHPDAGTDVASVAMARVNEAWRILSDPMRRSAWDRLHAIGAAVPPWTPPWMSVAPEARRRAVEPPVQPISRDSGWLAVGVLGVAAIAVAVAMIGVNFFAGSAPAAVDNGASFVSADITFSHPPDWVAATGDVDQPAGPHRVIAHVLTYSVDPSELCTSIADPCDISAESVPPGEASIIITAWQDSDGPPVPDPITRLPAGLDVDTEIGDEPAAFRWESGADGAIAWWQLSPPGFPDRWIEIHASLGGHEIEQREALQKVNGLLRTIEFVQP